MVKLSISCWLLVTFFVVNAGLNVAYSQTNSRVGTVSGSFLEMGFSAAGNAMGEAYVSLGEDLSSLYWNPAGLGYLENHEVLVMYQPWILDINTTCLSAGYRHPQWGSFAVSLYQTAFGSEPVTTVTMQEGTGEIFDGQDIAFGVSFGRKLVQWFSFGATAKYVSSRIWHERATALAVDLGAIVNTRFFSWSDKPGDGLNIGMSISNYGTRMRYDGIDLKETVDIDPFTNGNYAYVPSRYETESWELPLIARIGASIQPLIIDNHRITLSSDFLHANNNSEYMNVGLQYVAKMPVLGEFSLRGGYRGLFMKDSEYGLTFGVGMKLKFVHNRAVKFDYAFRNYGILGQMHTYTFSFLL